MSENAQQSDRTYLTITEAKKILDNAIHRAISEFRATTDESLSALRVEFIETTTMGARRDFEVSRIEIEVTV